MFLYGKEYSRRELEERIGRIEAIGGVRRFQMIDGPEAGVELIQVRTGAGLEYYTNTFRALDIARTEFCGTPLSWHSINGDVNPSFYNPAGMEWLRTAAGGLLMTCGLTQVGSPCIENGEQLGLHGRVHHLPAREVSATGRWEGDEYVMLVSGKVEETRIFNERLLFTRTIQSQLGQNVIKIFDVVENRGFESTPHMLLYHFNFGFPLMDVATEIDLPVKKVIPRDKDIPIEGYNRWQMPALKYEERVYYHQIDDSKISDNMVSVNITNPCFPINNNQVPLNVRLSWDVRNLPRLIQWKMPAAGVYALGIEPANCFVEGRIAERKRGTLIVLEPGEKRTYHVEMHVMLNS